MIDLKEIKYSSAYQQQYYKFLRKLILSMTNDIQSTVHRVYKKHDEVITTLVQDENPVNDMDSELSKMLRKWLKVFKDQGNKFIFSFMDDVNSYSKKKVYDTLKDKSLEFKIDMSKETRAILNSKKAIIEENIGLIKSVPQQHMDRVRTIIMQGISRSEDTSKIAKQIAEASGIPLRRARIIARDQVVKATSVLNTARYLELGFTKAKWRHSGGGKTQRKSHVNADGEVYDLKKGCLIDGEYIYPGQLINCKCTCTVVVD